MRIAEEAFSMLCGDLIGEGCSRKVYACALLPDCVVKVEETVGSFENVIEWSIWHQVVGTPASRWFAACRFISESGSILVMERTLPARMSDLPPRVPIWVSDMKRTNWGVAKDSDGGMKWAVCHDYGSLSSNVLKFGSTGGRMRKAQWIDS
jgi:hypothetical protein